MGIDAKDVVLLLVSLVAGLAFGFVPAWFFWRKKPQHGLDWALIAAAPILPPTVRRASPGLRVSVNVSGQVRDLESPQLTILRIFNAGTDAIPTRDGIIPPGIKIQHRNNKLVSVSIAKTHSDINTENLVKIDWQTPLTGDTALVTLEGPFDREWWFDLQLISDGAGGPPSVDAAIIGATRRRMRRLDQIYVQKRRRWVDMVFVVSALALFVLFVVGLVLDATLGQKTVYTRRLANVETQETTSFGKIFEPIWEVSMGLALLSLVIISIMRGYYWLSERRVRKLTRLTEADEPSNDSGVADSSRETPVG